MVGLLPLAGQWSFGEMDWTFRSQLVEPNEIANRFAAAAASAGGNSSSEFPDVGQELLDLARNLEIEPIRRGNNQLYLLDRPELKAQLVVRVVDGREKAAALAAAFPQDEGQWQLFEFVPRRTGENFKTNAAHLLPLPAAAKRTGGRFDDDGRLLLELVDVALVAKTLLSSWKNAGWDVRPTQFAGTEDFSYLCIRGNEVVYAWSANPRDSITKLMLVRSPAN
jgi:hypothetical protein